MLCTTMISAFDCTLHTMIIRSGKITMKTLLMLVPNQRFSMVTSTGMNKRLTFPPPPRHPNLSIQRLLIRTQDREITVVVGAASKGIIQRDHQHNAMVYKQTYASNPFANVSQDDVIRYEEEIKSSKKTPGSL